MRSTPQTKVAAAAERPLIKEQLKSESPDRNSVHIGRIDIQITPPPEAAKPAPRKAQAPSTSLSRGFPLWFGFREG